MAHETARLFAGRPWTGRVAYPSDGFRPVRWGVEIPIDRAAHLTRFDLVLHDLSALDELELQVWRRAPARSRRPRALWSRRAQGAGRASATGDIPILSRRFPVTMLFDGPPPKIPVHVRLPLDGLPRADAGETLVIEVSAFVDGSETTLSAGVLDRSGVTGAGRGFYGESSGARQPTEAFDLAWALFEDGPAEPMGTRPVTIRARDHDPALRQSHRLAIPPLALERFGDRFVAPAQEILVPVPASHPVGQALSLAPGGEAKALFRHFSGLTAKEGADLFETDGERGLIQLKAGNKAVRRTVEYVGHDCRYDLLSLNVRTGELELTLGEARARDPEEYAARPSPETIPAYALYTTHRDVELIPLTSGGSLVAPGAEAAHLTWLEDCRERLPRTFRKLRRGEPILLAGYGDSITALGGRDAAQNTNPDGPMRDRLGYFECYGKDWRANVPTFDHGDEAGAVHHHLGWNWALKQALEDRWGATVVYRNWGLAGTTSECNSRLIDGVEYLNGSHPLRLEAVVASRPDLVVVAFGMNDIGDATDTRANIRTICETLQAGGAEVLVVAPCRQNAGFRSRDPALWRWTHNAVIQGAVEAGAAWCATVPIMGEGMEGVLGLSHRSHSAATMGNHPGARELAAVGRYLSLIFT